MRNTLKSGYSQNKDHLQNRHFQSRIKHFVFSSTFQTLEVGFFSQTYADANLVIHLYLKCKKQTRVIIFSSQ